MNFLIQPIVRLPRRVKRGIAISSDAGLCVLTVWYAFYLRLGEWVPLSAGGWPAALLSLMALPIFNYSGLYRAVFRHVSAESLVSLVQAVAVYGVIYSAVVTAIGIPGVPRTVGIIQPILLLIAVIATRTFGRYWLTGRFRRRRVGRDERRRVLIYGAGSAGRQLAAALANSGRIRAVGLIDDDRNLHGTILNGLRVSGRGDLARQVKESSADEILLAIPSATRQRRNQILKAVQELGIAVRTLPDLLDIAHGTVTVSDLRPLDLDDLLGRDAVAPDSRLFERDIRNKCVLVTGAGGSIGSELCRQVLEGGVERLLLIDSSEFALYTIHQELAALVGRNDDLHAEIIPLLASVCDRERIRLIIETWSPSTIYHAAAYKHVPLVEHNVLAGLHNNVLGTWTIASLAYEAGTLNFVLISTDKAVRPTSIMGASKRMAEMVLQALSAAGSGTCFSMVRFGNVLGSSGSVVPLFREQIELGGPVTVTHREITRYFMTIPEAAELVLQAGAMATGGEVFVLDMGNPVRILDLAVRMIELSGQKVRWGSADEGVDIAFTGLRPGEKLYEELLIGNDPAATQHPRVMMANEPFLPLAPLVTHLDQLKVCVQKQDAPGAKAVLAKVVAEYCPAPDMADWVEAAMATVKVGRGAPPVALSVASQR